MAKTLTSLELESHGKRTRLIQRSEDVNYIDIFTAGNAQVSTRGRTTILERNETVRVACRVRSVASEAGEGQEGVHACQPAGCAL